MQLPTEYFCQVLGKWRKYSACLYRDPSDTLDQAEENMLQLYCDELHLSDELEVLDVGCGWGSFSLYAVRSMPALTYSTNSLSIWPVRHGLTCSRRASKSDALRCSAQAS